MCWQCGSVALLHTIIHSNHVPPCSLGGQIVADRGIWRPEGACGGGDPLPRWQAKEKKESDLIILLVGDRQI